MQTKKISFILAVLFATFFSVAKAQTNAGLSGSDLNSIVQQCVDLPGLQSFYPVHGKGNADQINIVNYPYAFPSETTVLKGGQQVKFISNESFSKEPVANYFMFRRIEQSGKEVKVIGNYFYTVNGSHLNKSIAIDYSNNNGTWTINKSTIK
jgi:hypothetical protein